ncbi:translation initiation factor IF-2 [Rhodobium orientis]|uniref:Translation initiation factor IF-2 n=1 Tax=Rhodobium orientis TaxID=34017 RepID=A0A327JS44_9HYPH|nr:translation initiation factor IF-2 [Rhodobium orientis]MBB4304518.1 translation initiation factor IF-2 [Rhodobium orientis]MBK5948109.1 translation initiation factor IF-2 [Rhodobium orientis]RAI26188.1 translation initiation factor IF-2 [Rhodobium orientis]
MSDSNNSGDKTIHVERKKTLSLKRTEQGTVRQSFSHGRSKAVVVEKKKRRLVMPNQGEAETATAEAPPKPAAKPAVAEKKPAADSGGSGKKGVVLRSLTSDEVDARAQALADARVREAEERQRAEEEAKRFAEEEARRKVEEEEARKKAEEEEARRKAEEEEVARQAAEAEARRTVEDVPSPAPEEVAAAAAKPEKAHKAEKTEKEEGEGDALKPVKRPRAAETKTARRGDERRRTKLTITSAFEDEAERGRSLAAMRRRREREKARAAQAGGPREKVIREVVIPETITIQELANRMAERAVDVIKMLMKQGQMLKINDIIDADTAQLIAEELGHGVKRVSEADVEEGLFSEDDATEDMEQRPPVVTIMGHVDHGKTSLLDAIRHANVVSGEAGGITQHIGAYQVEQNGQKITFIDTPGHAAFTAMRARGAQVTDVVILVVAADDGVMPQTIEAINHAKAAEVPIIVAINKIDKPGADPNRVRTELLQHEIVVESMGGDTLEVEVSALKKTNLEGILEAILLQTELMELKANPDREAEGIVIEAKLDKGRGPVATVLVQRGTLEVGNILVAGAEWGRVRALIDDHGEQVGEAGPSLPVEVLGFQGTPEAGDRFAVVENEARAREVVEYRQRQRREKSQAMTARGSLQQMMTRLQEDGRKDFVLLIKGDVQGSVEAISGALDKLGNDEVGARVIHGAVGGITESDVTLAAASHAPIIGFNVRANRQAREAAEREGVEIRYYNIIYDLVDDVKAAMSGMLSPERRETMLGNAEILEVFNISKVGKVAGCRVTDGNVERGAGVRLIRDDVVVHEGKLSTLKRFKDEVKSVVAGQECGMAFENYQDMRAGDVIECYRVEEVARTL